MTSLAVDQTAKNAKKAKKPRRFKWLRRAMRKIRYRFEAGIFHTVIAAFRVAGLARASAFSAWLMRTVGPRTKVHARAVRRMTRAMPEITEAEARSHLTVLWDKLGRTVAEYAFLDQLSSLGPDPRITVSGLDHVETVSAMDKGGIFFSGHFFNWELMPKVLHETGLPGIGVYRPANNPHINDWLVRTREEVTKLPQVSKNDSGARGIVMTLRRKQFVSMLIDQKIREGLPVPFFGHPAMTTTAPARLALKFGCPIIPACIERTGAGRYHVSVYPPLSWSQTGNLETDILALTESMNGFLEARIRERPDQWLWLHDRWGGIPSEIAGRGVT